MAFGLRSTGLTRTRYGGPAEALPATPLGA